ncbi:inositol monophosphatase family protein [Nocardia takedensis]
MSGYGGLLHVARTAATIGANLLASTRPGAIHAKNDRDFVTELDVTIERQVRNYLAQQTPAVEFLGEESAAAASGSREGLLWVLDPIDGTSNFIHGLPLCAVSLALVDDGIPVVGVVCAPLLGLEYHATLGEGAFVNGTAIAAHRADRLEKSIVSIGDYAVGPEAARKNVERLDVTAALASKVERVRMFGSAALDLVWVADGRIDGCVIMSAKPWDTAAGIVIARESGAVVVDSDGAWHSFDAAHTIAASPSLAPRLAALVTANSAGLRQR